MYKRIILAVDLAEPSTAPRDSPRLSNWRRRGAAT